MTSNQSTIYLRRQGYYTSTETVERVVRDIHMVNGFYFGKYVYRGAISICVQSTSTDDEQIWYTVSGQFPLTEEYEAILEEEE